MDRMNGADDEGSILPLTIGYALLAIVLILVCVDATSLYLAHKRTEAIADAAALAGSDGFELAGDADAPVLRLTDADVEAQASEIVAVYGSASLVDARTPDGASARVTVSRLWRPPIMTLFVPDGVTLEATATSRTALR
ncbi:pilus assembly protein TadG-related protein [Microbacterium sp. bgisy189]|uniref:pilus assembly protein TadG-related protein n=1 Tax=Microbacterium sp. bgisy189 TaxID=3413798 RepID=UPI003EBD71F3